MIRLGICNELFDGWDLHRVCRTVRALGYDGIEIAPFTLAPLITELTPNQRREIRETILDADLAVIGLHWLLANTEGLHLTHPDIQVRARTALYLCELAWATRDLGGSLMVLGSPKQRNLLPGVDYHQAFDHAAEVLRSVLPTLTECGVDLCLEPLAPSETDFLNTIAQANDLIRRLDHPRLKLHLDVKAMSTDPGGSVCELISKHGLEAGHFHAQDPGNLRGPGMGDLDFEPIVKSLAASGYNGWISVEVFDFTPGAEETAHQSLECLRRELRSAEKLRPINSSRE
ncbi:MAG: sugar phosphate isomerase/epimerase [Isosphaeraceae bacterium]